MNEELILINEYCENSSVDIDFILLLENEGLIETAILDKQKYIPFSQLSDLEMFRRLHYDLSINIEGIDVINNLLKKIQSIERELAVFRKHTDSDFFTDIDFFDELE
ncbi:chaperone modulator CbpM [Bacteroidales bacterium OttesenSCG-928-C19]|nr:chaperone modulator CbpM [Bacteroidales bacterium OttesenSCG-928-C19]